jgi:hypothetical protein
MSGVAYTILEYLAWISLGLALLLSIFVCVSIALAISSAVHFLALKWNLSRNGRRHHVVWRAGWFQPGVIFSRLGRHGRL